MTTTGIYTLVSEIGLDILVEEAEGAHDVPDFPDFRKIIIEDQANNIFTFTSFVDPVLGLQDNEELISPPSLIPNITVNFDFTTGDGVYKVTLCTIPTYDNTEPYIRGDDTVFFNDLIFECINDSLGTPPDTSPLLWKEITLEEVSAIST